MNVNNNSLQRVDAHWAVVAVGEAERDRGLAVANARLVKQALGQQIRIDFPERDTDDDLLRRLAMAYEMNWLRVLGNAEASQMDQGVSQQRHPIEVRSDTCMAFCCGELDRNECGCSLLSPLMHQFSPTTPTA